MSALVEVIFVFGVGQVVVFVLPSWLVGAIMCVPLASSLPLLTLAPH